MHGERTGDALNLAFAELAGEITARLCDRFCPLCIKATFLQANQCAFLR